tara:strand:- start:666 stop:1937 length:1272 start_codon:yes stop_codon:yes gene_type:complete
MINEKFLHFIWKFQLFNFSNLHDVNQFAIQILKPGIHNDNAGPDFLNARIKISDVLWCGDVEIHIKSSDWYAHKHQLDNKYDAVILHVVYEHNRNVTNRSGAPIICIELKNLIPDTYLKEYESLSNSVANLPCSYAIGNLTNIFWESFTEGLLIERLEHKMSFVEQLFFDADKNFQECFYQLLAYSLGLKINAEAMLVLSKKTPFLLLHKHRNNRTQIEALLYGQSGLIDLSPKDKYPRTLKLEYEFLSQKYKLEAATYLKWSFFRLRPSSFPTLRISFLADFVCNSSGVFEHLFSFKSLKSISKHLNLQGSNYWKSHYVFDKTVKSVPKRLGKSTRDLVLINAVLPFCFFYARQKSDQEMMMRVVEAYRELKAEENKIIRYYTNAAVKVKSAFTSQALIHLHQNYCIPRNCLNCRVFNQILK